MTKLTAKEKIRHAFIKQVSEKGFNQVSVSSIIKEAGIHRSTFYDHYQDKYDLLEQTQDSLIQEMHQALLNGREFFKVEANGDLSINQDQMMSLLLYIKAHQFELKAMQSRDLGREFYHLFRIRNDFFIDKAYESSGIPMSLHSEIPEDYYDELLMQSFFTTISVWLKKDCYESPETILKIMMRLTEL